MSTTITTTLVLLASGAVDRKASTEAFEAAVTKYETESKTEQETIAGAVSAVFDEHMSEPVKMPILAAFACQKLNAQSSNYSTLDGRVREYVRANSQETKDAKGVVTQHPNSLFVIGKGKGGGVRRRSDIPAGEPAESASE